nr:hypothetical protein [Tanacetum cinerariifolium]
TDAHEIAVTRPLTNIPLQERFIQVHLENSGGEVITVIINTENVYVVGYLFGPASRPTLYYLDDIPREELFQAFLSQQYNYSPLGFAGNYRSLPDREKTELEHGTLNDAIRNLYYRHSQPSLLLVIIQMVSEAARIRARSMENRWSDLSQQIQWSGVMRQAALALMLYRCNPKAIRMPVPVAVGADEQCLWMLWTFKSDGTIRSNGKCLTANGYASGDYIWIFDCDKAEPEATKWVLYKSGTIMNPRSGLVIAAESSTQRTVLNVAEDNNSSRQQWALYGDSNIRLYSDRTLCVTSNGHESSDSIFLLKGQGSGDEGWTFMADGTILNPNARLFMDVQNSDVSLKEIILGTRCYTSGRESIEYNVVIVCWFIGCHKVQAVVSSTSCRLVCLSCSKHAQLDCVLKSVKSLISSDCPLNKERGVVKVHNHVSKMEIGISIDGGIIDFKNLKFKDWGLGLFVLFFGIDPSGYGFRVVDLDTSG